MSFLADYDFSPSFRAKRGIPLSFSIDPREIPHFVRNNGHFFVFFQKMNAESPEKTA
jgi:hypothetical protein